MHELELKFSLPLSLQDALARDRDAAGDSVARVWSCYFDTPDGALARGRMAVRIRRHGDRWLQTVKADTGDRFERFEWEREIGGPQPDRMALPPEDTPQGALAHRTFGHWRPLFETDFERRARRLALGDGLEVELAQDVGEVRCGERREPIREVELERLSGSRVAFFEWAADWARDAHACLTLPTKNERGLRLAARLPLAPAPERATPAAPPPQLSRDAAAAAVLRACIAHACANMEPILASDAEEGPHQFRVALRRLRAALRFFELRERDPRWVGLDREAGALARIAGRVRDLDVFEAGALAGLRTRFPGDAALESLARATVDARDAARHELRRSLTSPPTTQFVLRVLALAERLDASAVQPPIGSTAPGDVPAGDGHPGDPAADAPATGAPDADPVAGHADSPPAMQPDASAAGSPVTASTAAGPASPDAADPGGAAPSPGGPDTPSPDSTADSHYGDFARHRIDALLARVRRRARRARSEEDWHQVRLAIKTLRYALDFAANALAADRDVARARTLLARWQEELGADQDRASARDVAADALSRPDVPSESAIRALALIDGWRAYGAPKATPPRAAARRRLRALRDAIGLPRGTRRGSRRGST